jgi:hypothetical protein
MAISRILFLHRFSRNREAVIYLAPAFRSAGTALEEPRLVPEGWSPVAGASGRRPIPSVLSCTAQGLSCPRAYAWGGGLLPRRFTLASRPTERCRQYGTVKRFVFCDTFRRKELSFSAPLLSQGGLPCGVRTFLSGFLRPRSDRPPTRRAYLRAAIIQGVSFAGWQARSRMLGAAEERD